MKLGERCAELLVKRVEMEDDLFVLDGDLGDSTGSINFKDHFPDRFIMGGISEQNIVAFAAGMAACNKIPWVFSFSSFLLSRAYDQIRTSISQTKLPVVLVGTHAGGLTGKNGKTHTILNDISIISSLPYIDVYAPASNKDMEVVVNQIMDDPKPSYIRLPKYNLNSYVETPRANGNSLLIITYGLATKWSLGLKNKLRDSKVDCDIKKIVKVHPLDAEDIIKTSKNYKSVVCIEDHYVECGLGSKIADIIPGKMLGRFGWRSNWAGESGDPEDILKAHNLDKSSLAEIILKLMNGGVRLV